MPRGIYKRTKPSWNKGLKRINNGIVDTRIVAYWEGKTRSNETINKIIKAKLGKHLTEETRLKLKGRIPWNKGIHTGFVPWNKGIKTGKNPEHSKRMTGRKLSTETRIKLSLCHLGSKSYLWKGGITPINRLIRHSMEYRLWRNSIFERDNYTCQICGKNKCYLEAHHIKRFCEYPNSRFDVNNGVTLCKSCHNLTKSEYFRVKTIGSTTYTKTVATDSSDNSVTISSWA